MIMTPKTIKPINKETTKTKAKVSINTNNTHNEVLEHCMRVRENLLKCNELEIISTYSETPNN